MATRTTSATPTKAKAHPTKAFFVRMLTRDISASDCILDLIDNSVDAAWSTMKAVPKRLEIGKRLAKFQIDLIVDRNRFSITDNCGGISLRHAAEYAFTFGSEDLDGRTNFSVGVYGIGMKRAVFKLGNSIAVRSTHKSDGAFRVPINVPRWLENHSEVWDFDLEADDPLDEPGVEIEVLDLTEETATTFADPTFVNQLRATIARDYMLALLQGLVITLNGRKVEGWTVGFLEGGDFAPMRTTYDDGEVSVEILAGMFEPPPNNNEPGRNQRDRSGWYVICNGRVVVAADRSSTTVWGRGRFPSYHPQFQGFLGVILFGSMRPELLPMNTTKNGVDPSSALYRRAQVRMEEPTRTWIDYTNVRKTRRDVAKEREQIAKPVPIASVKDRPKIRLPTNIGEPKQEANVLYAVPLLEMRALAKAFGRSTMAYTEVGKRSFRYAYDRLVSEEDK